MPRRFQCQLQNAEGVVIPDFAVRFVNSELSMVLSAGADNELANPSFGIGVSARILRRKSFIVMVVAIQNKFRIVVIQRLPEAAL